MSSTIAADSTATWRSSNPELPPDLDPEIYPIIAQHFYGLDLRDVRETWWDLARQGYPPAAEAEVIILDGGLS